ncbi:AMP-dependent synthetase [Pacificimonas flava]|uniref:AMP-dependent synthetase n=2 Tax=Pacificimonas TaxID=1960290 RepID=A0A219B3S7_9SPHN|nr:MULTISPECIES: class I adenylate-forming enzyme family protein [Pacificimonas]MBZ6377894.1 acyl--CoA ligase [Pacificimonas aurantium]OWV32448.1 AMP-dependent synthetase [Pacificimonas flava]
MPTELDLAMEEELAKLTAEGTMFEVVDGDVRGTSMPVFKNAPDSMRGFYDLFFAAQAEKEFTVYEEERRTFGDIYAEAKQIAAMLQHEYGIAKGDRVAIAMRNYPEWISAYVGAMYLGAVVVPINAWWTTEELEYGLQHSGTSLVIADEERLRRIRKIENFPVDVVTVRTSAQISEELGARRLQDALAASPDDIWYLPPLTREDDATIMYTSGSTGHPKGAVSTHGGLLHGAMNYLASGLAMLALAEKEGTELPEQQVMLLNVPLFHITGSVPVMLVSIAIGRKLVIMYKWDPTEALKLIERERATYFVGVPTMSLELMQHPDRDKYDTSTLMDIAAGGAPRPAEHVKRLKETFEARPAIGYGLTETNGVGAGNLRDNYVAKPSSTGRASKPMVELGIQDDDGNLLPQGERGEVCIRSAANCRGYWRNPQATAESFSPDGWFHTGDIGYLDEDEYLYIVDRKKDIIIRGGENIAAQEVEAAIYAHPAVAETSVFGLPDDRMGEIVGAVIYLKPGEQVERESLLGFLADDLANFKIPERIWMVKEPLPKLGSAKIDKVSLREKYREEHIGRHQG